MSLAAKHSALIGVLVTIIALSMVIYIVHEASRVLQAGLLRQNAGSRML